MQCRRRSREITWKWKKREECEASFTRERLVIIGFRVRLMTKFSSDHAPSKSPFDQSPPLLLVSQRVSDHRRALVSGYLVRETGPQRRREPRNALVIYKHLNNLSILNFSASDHSSFPAN